MRFGQTILTAALFFTLPAFGLAAPKGTKAVPASKTPTHVLKGVVVSVDSDKPNGSHEIKVKVHHAQAKKMAKSAAAAATSKKKKADSVVTVHVPGAAKVVKVVHSQGKVHRHKAQFSEVHKGEHVRVAYTGQHKAKVVDIVVHQHNKKATPPITKKTVKNKNPL